MLPPNYNLAQNGTPISIRDGGIAILKHSSINLNLIKTRLFSSSECIGAAITSSYSAFKIFDIYRPPSTSISILFTEFESLIEYHISSNINLFSLSDFNIKIDNINDYNTQNFKELLHNFNISQHVSFLTHYSGHILDLFINSDSFKLNINPFHIDTYISDHETICVDLNLPKSHIKKKLFLTAKLISISLNLIKIFLLHFSILNTSI